MHVFFKGKKKFLCSDKFSFQSEVWAQLIPMAPELVCVDK